jgi:hypothetical protein
MSLVPVRTVHSNKLSLPRHFTSATCSIGHIVLLNPTVNMQIELWICNDFVNNTGICIQALMHTRIEYRLCKSIHVRTVN